MSERVFFTSDTHFAHKRIQEFCPNTRPQDSLIEHDEELIYNWNSCVQKGDRIYHLGDFSFGSREYTEEVLNRLNGNIHIILGNHDRMLEDAKFKRYFASMQTYKEVTLDGIKVCMFHFPIWEWYQCHRGSFHLFGHVHANFGTVRGKSLNVGIDNRPNGDMMPWSWQEVKEFMADKPLIVHH